MGAVYRARHLAMDSVVALKVLRREASEDLDAIERFYREAKSASKLKHPNTITVFDFGQSDDGQLFIAMEHLEGRSLRAELRRVGRMPEARALRVAEQVAMSLGEAHSKGIVHRDIKPENIFLMELYGVHDFVKVLDFGVAHTASNDSITRTGLAVGTPSYMSPEQAQGAKVDARADLYSLGVMMFEMVAGIPPFESNTPMHLMLMHMNDAPPSLRTVCGDDVGSGFEKLVMDLLAKSVSDRPASADVLLERIHELKEHASTVVAGIGVDQAGHSAMTPVRPNMKSGNGFMDPYALGETPTSGLRLDGPRKTSSGRQVSANSVGSTQILDVNFGTFEKAGQRSKVPLVVAMVILLLGGGGFGAYSAGLLDPLVGVAGDVVVTVDVASVDPAPEDASTVDVSANDSNDLASAPATARSADAGGATSAEQVGDADDTGKSATTADVPALVITVGSEPSSAVVLDRDGTVLGRTPLDVHVQKDEKVSLTLRLTGYRDETLELDGVSMMKDGEIVTKLSKIPRKKKPAKPQGGGWSM